MFKPYKLDGYIDYPGVGKITDEDVYQVIRKHSRLVDRLNPRKMLEMSFYAQAILMKVAEPEDAKTNPKWKFYNKKHKSKK